MLFDDGAIGGNVGIDGILGEFKEFFGFPIIQIVKEDSAQPASFIAVGDDEVSIGPRFELGVELRIMTVAHLLIGSVKVLHIIQVEVGGGNISTATEPPNATIGFKVAIVEMHSGTEWIARMHDTGKSTSEEWYPLARSHTLGPIHPPLGSRLQRLLGHGSVDHRKVDTGLLPNGSILEDAGHAPAAVGAGPAIFLEGGLSVGFCDGVRDGDLGLVEHLFEAGPHGVVAVGAVSGADEGVWCFVLLSEGELYKVEGVYQQNSTR